MGDNIDKLFRDKLKDQEIEFNEQAWAGAQEMLKDYNNKITDNPNASNKSNPRKRYILALLFLFIIGIGYTGYQWKFNNNQLNIINPLEVNDVDIKKEDDLNNNRNANANIPIKKDLNIELDNEHAKEENNNDLISNNDNQDHIEDNSDHRNKSELSLDMSYEKGTKVYKNHDVINEKNEEEISYPETKMLNGEKSNNTIKSVNVDKYVLNDKKQKQETFFNDKQANKKVNVDQSINGELVENLEKDIILDSDYNIERNKESIAVIDDVKEPEVELSNVVWRSALDRILPLPSLIEIGLLMNDEISIGFNHNFNSDISNNSIIPVAANKFKMSLAAYVSLAFETDVKFDHKQVIGGFGIDWNFVRKFCVGFGVSYKYHDLKEPILLDRVAGTYYGLRATDVVSTLYADQFHELEIPFYVGYRIDKFNLRLGMSLDYTFAAYGNANEGGLNGTTIKRGWLSLKNYKEKYNYFGQASISYEFGKDIELGLSVRTKLNKVVNEVPMDQNDYSFKLFFNYYIF